MVYLLAALLFAVFSSLLASQKNRSAMAWFIVGLLFGPFGLLVAFFEKLEANNTVESEAVSFPDGSVIFAELNDADWGTAKGQLLEAAKQHGYRTISVNNAQTYMLKNPNAPSSYINMKRKNGAIYIETVNAPAIDIEIAKNQPYVEDVPATGGPEVDVGERLIELGKLVEKGLLTEDEFAAQKAKLLQGGAA